MLMMRVAGAGPFYEKCGFTEMGRVTYRITPLIYYERSFEPRVNCGSESNSHRQPEFEPVMEIRL